MTGKRHVTFRVLLFLICIDLLETFAQFCFKKSALPASLWEVHDPLGGLRFIAAVLPSPFLWAGLLSVLVIFISWSTILSRIDLSVAVPVCSFSYISVPLVSMLFFGEHVSPVRWAGICLILTGVILVSMSSMRKEVPLRRHN